MLLRAIDAVKDGLHFMRAVNKQVHWLVAGFADAFHILLLTFDD